jgi:hypothetical protein
LLYQLEFRVPIMNSTLNSFTSKLSIHTTSFTAVAFTICILLFSSHAHAIYNLGPFYSARTCHELGPASPAWANVVGYWKLNGTPGAITNGTSIPATVGPNGVAVNPNGSGLGYRAGQVNGAIKFDGVDDQIDLPHQASLDLSTAWTAALWVNYAALPSGEAAIFSDQYNGGNVQFCIGDCNTGDGTLSAASYNGGNGGWHQSPAKTLLNSDLGTWMYVVGVYNGAAGTISLYVNGALFGTTSGVPSTQPTDGLSKRIGRRWDSPNFTNASVDDVALWSTALTSAQVLALYNSQSALCPLVPIHPQLLLSLSGSAVQATCSGPFAVEADQSANAPQNVATDLTVSFAPVSGVTYYADSYCSTQITNATITTGTSSTTFYIINTNANSPTLTASASGYASSSLTPTFATNPFLWTGAGANANWSNGANWQGGAAPGSSDTAVLDGSCTVNCSPTINASITIGGIYLAASYAGNLTQAAGNSIAIGNQNWTQVGGTFNGGDASISFSYKWLILGGSFRATSGLLSVNGDTKISNSATFNANSGSVVYPRWDFTITSTTSALFNNVSFTGCCYSASVNGTLVVNGVLTLSSDLTLYNGTILASGDVNASGGGLKGTVLLKLVGSSSQTVIGAGTSPGAGLPSVEIASTGGLVAFTGYFRIIKDSSFTYTSGTVDMISGASTLQWMEFGNTISTGSMIFNNINFSGCCYSSTLVGNMQVNGSIKASGDLALLGGTMSTIGNVDMSGGGVKGTTVLRLIGSSNQTVTGTVAATGGYVPSIEIASSGGTVSFVGYINLGANFQNTSWTYTSGTVDMITGNSTLQFPFFWTTITPGSMVFNNVTFSACCYNGTLSGTMIINGTLNGSSGLQLSGGTISAKGNVDMSGGGLGGTYVLLFSGTGDQIYTPSASNYTNNVTVNGTGNRVIIGASAALLNSNWTVTSGSVYLSGYTLEMQALTLNSNILHKQNTSAGGGVGVLNVNGATIANGTNFGGTIAN